jgi:Bacterial SH3 domain
MQNKLILTLWLVGAVLYAASTVFLAHTVLGGGAADKAKTVTLAAANDAQCQKDNVAAADAKPAKAPAADTQKTAAVEPNKPVPAPNAAKPAAPGSAAPDSPEAAMNSEQQSAENEAPPEDQQAPDASSPDGAPAPEGWQQQDARGQGPGEGQDEQEEWAHVVAGTADMRSEPSLQSQLIYALPAGWQVRVISRQPGWVQVQDANSGAAGWVESSAIAPGAGPGGPGSRPGYAGGPPPYGDPNDRYAQDGYPYPPPPWRRQGPVGEFLRRALGGW